MKRSSVWLILAALMMATGNAQETAGFEVSLSSGYVIPSSPMSFANYWRMAYGGSVGAGYVLSPSVTLLASAEYYRFNLNADGLSDGFDTKYMRDIWIFEDVSMQPTADPSSILTLTANMRIAPSGVTGMVSPYFIAGIGMMRFALSEIALPTTSALSVNGTSIAMTAQRRITGGMETAVTLQYGAGLDVRFSDLVVLYVEVRNVQGLSNNLGQAYFPIVAGMKYHLTSN